MHEGRSAGEEPGPFQWAVAEARVITCPAAAWAAGTGPGKVLHAVR